VGILRRAELVCCTITGASIQTELLREVGFRVVLVEEAAEIMQPQLLAALPPSVEQLVQIGDHRQLRPQLEIEELGNVNHLDVSMMERLVEAGRGFCAFTQLTRQSRMMPEFVSLIADIYPDLETATERIGGRTQPALLREGVSMFFKDTSAHKSTDAAEGRSTINRGEVGEICELCKMLVHEGCEQAKITALALYKGQRMLLRHELSSRGLKDVVVETVDQYQGDENDIVLVSITRSDHTTRFVDSLNRRCVAASRARCCMIFFGCVELLAGKSPVWQHVIKTLQARRCVGAELPLVCPRHAAGAALSLGGRCAHVCRGELPCGHRCGQACHPAVPAVGPHLHPPCREMTDDKFECGHPVKRLCSTPLTELKCSFQVSLRHKGCGHDDHCACHEQATKRCTKPEPIVCTRCGQEGTFECWRKLEEPRTYLCPHPCTGMMSCGHPCTQPRCGDRCDDGLEGCPVCAKEREARTNARREEIKAQLSQVEDSDFFRISCMPDSRTAAIQKELAVYFGSEFASRVVSARQVQNARLEQKFLIACQRCAHLEDSIQRFVRVDSLVDAEAIAKDGFETDVRWHFIDVYGEAPEEELELSVPDRVYLLCKVQLGREYVHGTEGGGRPLEEGVPSGFDSGYDPEKARHRLWSRVLLLPVGIVQASVQPAEVGVSLPPHWSAEAGRGSHQGWSVVSVADNDVVMSLLRKLLETDGSKLGKGRDVVEKDDYSRLVLAHAWRIENPRLWRRYAIERQGVCDEIRQSGLKPPRVKLRGDFWRAGSKLPEKLMEEVNEVRLLHGTKPQNVRTLLTNGLNERFSGGMFGCGSYLAEDAGKNDQYCTKDAGARRPLQDLHRRLYRDGVEHPGDVFYLFLCRVVMGVFVRSQTGDGNAKSMDGGRPVFATEQRRELAPIGGGPCHYHSLLVELGGQISRYREIVQFHDARIYPEYLLAYQRRR